VNLGKYPDDITPHTQTSLNVIPYLAFYNKYKGVLRVFVQYGYNETPPNSIKGVKIELKYSNINKMSGILRLGEGSDQSLDQNSDVKILTAIAPKTGQQSIWMSADFQLSYDPCVCFIPSNLNLDFHFFS